jgi:hypothetical protein
MIATGVQAAALDVNVVDAEQRRDPAVEQAADRLRLLAERLQGPIRIGSSPG